MVVSATTSVMGCSTRVAVTTVTGSEPAVVEVEAVPETVWAWEKAAIKASGSTANGARKWLGFMMTNKKDNALTAFPDGA